jgi:hypothetical protein
MTLELIPLMVIAGFLAGSIVAMQVLRWIVLLQATTAAQSGDFLGGTKRRLLWSAALIALLHPAPYLLAASLTATVLWIAGRLPPGWGWFFPFFYLNAAMIAARFRRRPAR